MLDIIGLTIKLVLIIINILFVFNHSKFIQGLSMLSKKFHKFCVTPIFVLNVLLPMAAMGQTDLDAPSIPIDAQKVYSISVKPNSTTASTSYTLKVFTDEKEQNEVIRATRPLDGRIVDVEIYDVDDDGSDELVVMMVDNVSISQVVNFDVFEFDGKKLEWIENFEHVSKLFELYNKVYGEKE